jgi:hypothetical protein
VLLAALNESGEGQDCQTARNRDPLSAPNRDPSFPRISGEARSPQQAQSVAAG